MKKYLLSVLTLLSLATACTPLDEKIDPAIQSKVPSEAQGQWMWGAFSRDDFKNYNGTISGKPFEQCYVLELAPNGEFEQYVINSASSYSCKTEAFSYFKGKVKFNEEEESFTLTQTYGNFRGYYSCYPNKNFRRDAKASELKTTKYYYSYQTSGNRRLMVLRATPNDSQGMFLTYSE
ncbi:hypothetical protein [Tellurirhabdus rosea]|uniref:hypothetical protein n=1 Tax=Tellurirhabdus rosea TaxID=2674997 RepID=UPI002252AE64|nr:hypothetical protein [Tellurirhabdus rosea]